MFAGTLRFTGLRYKFILAILLVLLPTLFASADYQYENQKTQLINGLIQKANALGKFISLTSPEAIYSLDITTLDRFIEQIITDIDIHYAVIIGSNGIPLTTIQPRHKSWEQLSSNLAALQDDRFIHLEFAIQENETLLGDLHIIVDKQRVSRLINQNLKKSLITFLVIILFLASVIFFIFHLNVLRPVQQLIAGSSRIRQGNLSDQVPVLSRDELGQLTLCFNDMTRQLQKEQIALKETNQRLSIEINQRILAQDQMKLAASVFSHAREGIIITDPSANIIDVNEAFSQITGFTRNEVLGKNPKILQSKNHDSAFYQSMWQELVSIGHWTGEIWNRHKNGQSFAELLTISAVTDDQGKLQHYVALFSDITHQKRHQQQLEHIAHYDSLTGLPNRLLLTDRLHQAMALEHRNHQGLAIVYLDLDGFKAINDQYGHDQGDKLLIRISLRMAATLREADTLARLGGDEFVIVLNDSNRQGSLQLINRILEAVSRPVNLDPSIEAQVSASIGVTFYPQEDEVDVDHLLRQADQAMYQAKLQGKNRYYLFDPAKDKDLRGHHENLERLRQALNDREFTLYFQPKVNLISGDIVGAEALIRWIHPEDGLIAPGNFLPMLEGQPLAVEVGEWVITETLTQIESWKSQGLELPVSVNIDAFHLQQDDFVSRLEKLLQQHPSVDSSMLEIEILETSALEYSKVALIMQDCEKLGIGFSLDDFGTGYSSLTYLKNLPTRTLKIDQSFVRDMLEDPEDLAIVEAVLGLTTAFRREVLAEGVETYEHGEMLIFLGCEMAQGYVIARPMPAEKIMQWVADWRLPQQWQTLRSLQRKDIHLLFSLVEHRAWIASLIAYVTGKPTQKPEMNKSNCRFGQWISNHGAERYLNNATFQAIEREHEQIHDLANHMLVLFQQGHQQWVEDEIQTLLRLRDQLITTLKDLLMKR